jgi:CO dehydrogenase maturation factor
MKIIICGKGGSGKSSIAALLTFALGRRGKKVLLVDADESNIGLYRMLGLDLPESLIESFGGKKGFQIKTNRSGLTLGGESALFERGMTAENLPDHCIASFNGIRVMSIGKILHFGEGCACPMGKLFRMLFSSLHIGEDELVIVDTAAGVEHFGRNLDGQCDHVLCVVDPSYESMMMAKRVASFATEGGLPLSIVLNKVTDEIEKDLMAALTEFPIIGRLPLSNSIFLNNFKGTPLHIELPEMESICTAIEGW